ncbi:MAG: M6 family metalloprotease domain-containing protein, partial [Candidatus Zixiibacteriota bacterium]
FIACVNSWAVSPSDEAIEKWKAEGVWEQKVAIWRAFKQAGGCAPEKYTPLDRLRDNADLALGYESVRTIRVLVILVDFSDNPGTAGVAAGTAAAFDSILFSDPDSGSVVNPTGSMTQYYLENSYGQVYITGDIVGWYRMPETYDYYVGSDDGLTHSPELVRTAVDSAAPDVDFMDYDNNGDFWCDGVVVIHAGRGAEDVGYGIWSHKWEIPPVEYDGVIISAYTMNPEEVGYSLASIGVFCHEYGHILGLPDLYDITPGTLRSGVGNWSLMGSGSWLQQGKKPAHLDAWSKAFVGFINLIQLDSNAYHWEIPAVEYNPVAYKLTNSISEPNEYWIVENRQKTGFDAQLPGAGLLIYHIDEDAAFNNSYDAYLRYHVAVEQADGLDQLADTIGNQGDAGDPWPGSTNAREFHNLTIPDSKTNISRTTTRIGVWDISNSDSVMMADFDVVDYSRPYILLDGGEHALVFNDDPPEGDGDGVIEAGETIRFWCTVKNLMRGSYWPRATLSTNNPAIDFITNDVPLDPHLFDLPRSNVNNPIEFKVADTLTPVIDSFYLTITTDSLEGTPGSGEFTKTFGIEKQIGAAQVLIVDDDRGQDYEDGIEEVFSRLRIPAKTWEKQSQGSPSAAALEEFNMVFWHTGDTASGVLNANDVTAMKGFMDNGGNILLSTVSGVNDLAQLDSAFLADYFRVTAGDAIVGFIYEGLSNS